jgi:hypothetical protein
MNYSIYNYKVLERKIEEKKFSYGRVLRLNHPIGLYNHRDIKKKKKMLIKSGHYRLEGRMKHDKRQVLLVSGGFKVGERAFLAQVRDANVGSHATGECLDFQFFFLYFFHTFFRKPPPDWRK